MDSNISVASLSEFFRSSMNDFEAKLAAVRPHVPGEFDLERLTSEFLSFKKLILSNVTKLMEIVEGLENRVDDLETYSRRNCLLIHGLEECEGENIDEVVNSFFATNFQKPNSNFEFNSSMIDRTHRIGRLIRANKKKKITTEVPKPRPVIVKFVSYAYRKVIWSNKRVLKGTKVLITESLTKRRMELFRLAKEVFGVGACWTHDGRILVAADKDKKAVIKSVFDLEKLSSKLKLSGRVKTRSQNK